MDITYSKSTGLEMLRSKVCGFFHHSRAIVDLSWPVLVAQFATMGMMITDTVLTGHYGTQDLAAIAIGSSIYIPIIMALVGVLHALTPTVAHVVGGKRHTELGVIIQQGFWLAVALSAFGIIVLRHPTAVFSVLNISITVKDKARAYLDFLSLGLPAVLFYRTFFIFTSALGRPRPMMVIGLFSTGLHIILSYSLINGRFGMPELGAVGCGLSSMLVSWVGLCGVILYLVFQPFYRDLKLFTHWHGPSLRVQSELLTIGLPIGFSFFFEIMSFTVITLFVGELGSNTVAAHRIVANLASICYMVPVALGNGTAVLVGQAIGAQEWKRARDIAISAIMFNALLSTFIGVTLWSVFARDIIYLYTPDFAVRAIALSLIGYIVMYQLFDACQTTATYVLRGYKITLMPLLIHICCFWGVGVLSGYVLAFHKVTFAGWTTNPMGLAGFWLGGALSCFTAALLLLTAMNRVTANMVRIGNSAKLPLSDLQIRP